MMRRLFFATVVLLVVPSIARSQGTISTQGFGYPPGGLSTRSGAAGGGFAEFDFATPRNPSSTLGWGRGGLYFQYEPEFRSVTAGPATDNTMNARFPIWMAGLQLGSRAMGTITASTYLDRTWATNVRGGQILGTDSVGYEERVESNGAINDIRLGVSYSVRPTFSVGFGLHGFTGENRLSLVRQYDDSLVYGTLTRALTISYLGSGFSAGATWRLHPQIAVAASARAGGELEVGLGDTVIAKGRMPMRFGAGIRFDGLPGASLGISIEHQEWSRLDGLLQSDLTASDTWELGTGLELTGPKMRNVPILFYLGYRQRDLPFHVGSEAPKERFYSGGTGLPLAGPRVVLDMAVQRATRGSVDGVTENAWIFSMGFTVRP
jgi:hypothetical protein